jgi:hypothetical protein
MGLQSWVLGKWENHKHYNLGDFADKPTIDNFIKHISIKAKLDWL